MRGEKGVIFGGEFAPVDGANGVRLLPLLPAALPEGILAKKKKIKHIDLKRNLKKKVPCIRCMTENAV